jgi:hypothetical protein
MNFSLSYSQIEFYIIIFIIIAGKFSPRNEISRIRRRKSRKVEERGEN